MPFIRHVLVAAVALIAGLPSTLCAGSTTVHGHRSDVPKAVRREPRERIDTERGARHPLPPIVTHDNREPAGSLADGVLTLELRAQLGVWHSEGDAGRALTVEAFGDGSSPPSAPAPLIRVPEGTEIAATVRNDLEYALRVFGLCDRSGSECPPIDVPARERRVVRFKSGPAGTYHYAGTTLDVPLPFRAAEDFQLSGAFIVDPPGGDQNADRIFVITEWVDLTREQVQDLLSEADLGAAISKLKPDLMFLINGRSWPHTERLTYRLGDRAHWRVVNLSTSVHPMHLHGFYFEVPRAHRPSAVPASARESRGPRDPFLVCRRESTVRSWRDAAEIVRTKVLASNTRDARPTP
jgi:FtsP/CotA-like multicopper oxidase with cupredoxin domain